MDPDIQMKCEQSSQNSDTLSILHHRREMYLINCVEMTQTNMDTGTLRKSGGYC